MLKTIEECHEDIKKSTHEDNQEKNDQEKVEMLQQLFSFSQFVFPILLIFITKSYQNPYSHKDLPSLYKESVSFF